jgi:hypothetical protein
LGKIPVIMVWITVEKLWTVLKRPKIPAGSKAINFIKWIAGYSGTPLLKNSV